MRDPIFKGATRPVMWLGVPQMAFILLMLSGVVLTMWTTILISGFFGFVIGLAALFIYAIMRIISVEDPHRLMQLGKQFQSWVHGRANKSLWGAHSASPATTSSQRRIGG